MTTRMGEGTKGPLESTWTDALIIGLAQAVAITPGISRSGSTIVAALALGFSRPWAVGFSLLMAVPAILGAAVLEVREIDPQSLTPEFIRLTAVASAVSGLVGYGAIVWLVRIVRAGRLWYFSVYLVLLSATVLGTVALSRVSRLESESRGMTDGQGRRSEALDRPTGLVMDRPGSIGSGFDDVGRPDTAGPGPPGEATGPDEAQVGPVGR
jgi:undecaprenyl-diphosphatase